MQCLFQDKISFLKKAETKYKGNFNFIFIYNEKNILEISYIFAENSGTNQNFIEHVHAIYYFYIYITLFYKYLYMYIDTFYHTDGW